MFEVFSFVYLNCSELFLLSCSLYFISISY